MEMTSSAYQCNCPICGYETSDDRQFKLHVDYNHPPFWNISKHKTSKFLLYIKIEMKMKIQ